MANTDLENKSYIFTYGTTPNVRSATSQKVRFYTPHYGQSQPLHLGVASQMTYSENRNVEEVRGIGYGDQLAELVPGNTTSMQLQVDRTLLNLSNVFQATGYAGGLSGPVRSMKHHRWPFDVEEQLVGSVASDKSLGVANIGSSGKGFEAGYKKAQFPSLAPTIDSAGNPKANAGITAIVTMYEACWFQSYNRSINKDQAVIMESTTLSVTDVHDAASTYGEFLASGNDPTVGQLGSRRFKTA